MNDNNQRLRSRSVQYRQAFSTIETLVALISAAVLMMGLGSAVFIASNSAMVGLQPEPDPELSGNRLSRLREDIRDATSIDVQPGYLSIIVPDRTGDQLADEIRIAKQGNVLTSSVNGGTARTLADDISVLKMKSKVLGTPPTAGASLPTPNVQLRATSTARGSAVSSLTMNVPAGSIPGDLLIVIVAESGYSGKNPDNAAWSKIDIQKTAGYRLSWFYKFVAAGDPSDVVIAWDKDSDALGYTICLTGVASSNPIANKKNSIGTYVQAVGVSGPSPVSLSGGQDGYVAIQTIVTSNSAFSSSRTGLSGYADIACNTFQDLGLAVCISHLNSTNAGLNWPASYVFIENNQDFVAMGAVISN